MATFIFDCDRQWSLDHLFFVKELVANGLVGKEIRQVDLHGRPGWYIVTVFALARWCCKSGYLRDLIIVVTLH